ncbi:MAG TPA: YcaO-like family protein [Acidimicrobiales bacterium]|nr:YcaO-like family protein [Acidimicrobiales bacterium]
MIDPTFGPERLGQYEAVTRLYNRLLGPVTRVNVLRPEANDLPLFTSSCQHSSVGSLLPDLTIKQAIADAVIIPGGGKGIDAQATFVGGLGEISERLLGVLHFSAIEKHLTLATYEDLVAAGRQVLGPEDVPLFAPEQYARPQFPYTPFDHDTPLRWLDGQNLLTGETVAVPAQMVLLYYKHHPDEARIAYPTTGGLAFHSQRLLALLHGVFEVIERDAINTRWYGQVPPRRVLVDFRRLGSEAGRGWPTRWSTADLPEVEVYLNDTDLLFPVFTSFAVDVSRTRRALLGGGGADSSRLRALTQALFELGQTRTSLKYYQSLGFKEIRADSTVSEMTDFFDTAMFYGFAENLPLLDWYRRTTETVDWADIPDYSALGAGDACHMVLTQMRDMGMTPLAFEFTGASWPGVFVTKVFVPQLTQACLPSHPYLGHPRFYDLPFDAPDRERTFATLNTNPVPFP